MDSSPTSELWRGIPMWVRAACLLGGPTIAAGYLIWLVSGALATDVRAMRSDLLTHATATASIVDRFNELRATQEILIRLQTTQCVNEASDVLQRRDCLNAAAR